MTGLLQNKLVTDRKTKHMVSSVCLESIDNSVTLADISRASVGWNVVDTKVNAKVHLRLLDRLQLQPWNVNEM